MYHDTVYVIFVQKVLPNTFVHQGLAILQLSEHERYSYFSAWPFLKLEINMRVASLIAAGVQFSGFVNSKN